MGGAGHSFSTPLRTWLERSRALPGRKEDTEQTISVRSAFHGLRDGPQGGRAASPAATFRGPVGAEDRYSPQPRRGPIAALRGGPPDQPRKFISHVWVAGKPHAPRRHE